MFHHCPWAVPLCLCLPASLCVSTNRHGWEMIVFILPVLTKFLDFINLEVLWVFFRLYVALMHFVCLNELHPVPAWVCSLRFHEVSSWWIHKSELQLSPCFFHIKKHSTSFSYWWMVEINRPVPAHHLGVTELPPRLRESFLMRSDLSETNGWFTVQQTKKELFQNGKHHSTSYPERFFSLCLSEISAIDVKSRDSKAQISLKGGSLRVGMTPISRGFQRMCPAPVLFLLRSYFQALPHWGF